MRLGGLTRFPRFGSSGSLGFARDFAARLGNVWTRKKGCPVNLEIENADTENISSRKRSRCPPFEKRKEWGTLSCSDIGTERMGHPSAHQLR